LFRPAVGRTQPPIQLAQGALFLVGKVAGVWSSLHISTSCFHGLNRDNFTFSVIIAASFLSQVLFSKLPPNQNYALVDSIYSGFELWLKGVGRVHSEHKLWGCVKTCLMWQILGDPKFILFWAHTHTQKSN
jgi:hypothetical protein